MSNYIPAVTPTQDELAVAEGFVKAVYDGLIDMTRSFFRIGFLLTEARDNGYFRVLGYATIEDLAADKFDFERSTTYNFMQVYAFARDWKNPMCIAEKYEKFSRSQLLEMSRATWACDDLVGRVTPADKVADIRKFIKIWNKEYRQHGRAPLGKTVKEVLERYDLKQSEQYFVEAAPPQRSLLDLSEVQTSSEFAEYVHTYGQSQDEPTENSVHTYGQNQDEPEQNAVQIADKAEYAAPMTDDELITYCVKLGTGCIDGKFRIFYKYQSNPTRAEFVDYVKNEYGAVYMSGDVNFGGLESYSRGLTIKRKYAGEIALPWNYITGKISRLIETNNYLTVAELNEYAVWKAVREKADESHIEPEEPAEPAEEFFQTSEGTAPAPRAAQTNKEYLAMLPSAELAEKLCLKIIQLIPWYGKSAQFISEVRPKLAEWLSEPCEGVTE